jgi:hypothetical protein
VDLVVDSPLLICYNSRALLDCLAPISLCLTLSAQPCPALNTSTSSIATIPQTLITPLITVFSIDVAPLSNPTPKAYLLLLLSSSCGAWSTSEKRLLNTIYLRTRQGQQIVPCIVFDVLCCTLC